MARWDNPGIPHKGWTLVGCVDLGEGVYGDDEIEYETCEMCHNEKIRYVHIQIIRAKFTWDVIAPVK